MSTTIINCYQFVKFLKPNCNIYEIEYGKKTVKDFEALAFCKVLGISLEDLYSDTDKYYEA